MDARKSFLLVVLAFLLWLSYLMVKPFLGYLVGAALIAFILRPFHRRLKEFISPKPSAFILVFLSIFLAVFPFIFAANAVIEDARDLGGDIDTSNFIDVSSIERQIADLTGREIDISRNLNAGIEQFSDRALGGFSEVLSFLTGLAIGLGLMIFLMYYLVLEGDKLVKWIKEAIPMDPEVEEELFDDIERTTWAVINGHVLVAFLQGILAGIGLFAVGIPNYIFWTFVMILLGFIPIVGTFIVWGPAAAYLFVSGDTVSAVFLAIYGLVVVGITDDVVRAYAVDRKADIHPSVVLIGVLGGVYLFGAVGLFIGPIILGILRSVLLVLKNNY